MEEPDAPETKQDLEMRLRDLLGDVVTFKFLAHGFHWNVRGINFSQFHEFFGEIYEDADGSIDPIAENIRKLNFDAPFRLQDFIESADELEPTDSSDPLEMSRSLYMANEDVRESIVHALACADELSEQGIVNFLAERQDMHSKWQWQLRAIVGNSFANNYEIDVEEVSEGYQTGEGNEKPAEISPEDKGNPASAMTNADGTPMYQQNSISDKWHKAANMIIRRLDPPQDFPVESRKKKFETRINHTEFEMRAVEDGKGMTFEGYASVFNSPSEPIGGKFTEYVAPGAFKRSLSTRSDVKLLWNHDTGQVLGSTRSGTLKLIEDGRGLKAIATLPDTQLGRDTAVLLKRGDVSNMSFGFSVPAGGDSWNSDGNIRTLNSVRLHEVSITAFPAYPTSTATVRSVSIDADALAESLMRLENGEELEANHAALINDVVAKLTKTQEVQDAGSILDLKKKQLDLLMKRI
jgi:HK97 family phage prohead protease